MEKIDKNIIQGLFFKLKKGDRQSYEKLYNIYKNRFYAVALKMTRSEAISEDLVQDVFVTLWVKRDLVTSAENPEHYLFRILQNKIFEQFRSVLSHRIVTLEHELTLELGSGEDIIVSKENIDLVEKMLAQLPPGQKEVFRLVKIEGMKRDEVADLLKISPNTVKNQLHAAIDHIRKNYSSLISWAIWLIIIESI